MNPLPFIALILILPVAHAQEDPGTFVPPQKPRPTTYQSLWLNSPFTEKEVIVTEQGPGFAENLILEGFLTLGGEDVAVLTDTTTEEVLYVSATKAPRGITLVEVKNRGKEGQTSVILASGDERTALEFSEDKLVVAPSAGAAAQNTKANGPPNNNGQPANQQTNTQNQQASVGNPEKTTLSEEEMRERRRKFWESMRDRRSRGR